MWVLWDTKSLQCINISEWFLFHAYISDVTLIFATDYCKACFPVNVSLSHKSANIYMSNKIRSVKIIWSLGNEQKHSHDFSIHMQLYRVFMKSKYNSCVLRPQISIANFHNNPKAYLIWVLKLGIGEKITMNKCGYRIGLNVMLV